MWRGFVMKVFIVMIPEVEIRFLGGGGLQSHVCPQWPRHHTCHTEHQSVCRGACNWFHVSTHVKVFFFWRRASSVSIITGIPVGRTWIWGSIRGISKRFSSSQQQSYWFRGPPSPLSNWASGSFVRDKVARLEADRSPLSSAWSYTAYVHSAIDLCDKMFNYVWTDFMINASQINRLLF